MNPNDDDKVLNEIYRSGNKDQPPEQLDQIILQHAQHSHATKSKLRSWRPWLAAASIVLVMPIIWLLVQNEKLLDQAAPNAQLTQPQKPKPAKELSKQEFHSEPEPVLEEALMAPAESNQPAAPAADMAVEADDLQNMEEQGKIAVTGSRFKREDPASLETESVKANRELLMNELKVKKKTLKQSNLDPILAMELQRFEMYLEKGKINEATQLLQEMQEREPDFDYSELEQRLADAGSD